jgi:hypothetical protein
MPQPELTLASLGETTDLTDRERLALAFGILREQGWFAPVEWSTTLCCTPHGWEKVIEHFGMTKDQWMETDFDHEPPTLWWNTPADSAAFLGTFTESPMTTEMEERLDAIYEASGDDDEAVAAWMEAHQDELDADEVIERTTHLVNLVDELGLHWSGGMAKMQEAVDVMRSVGLCVSESSHPNHLIVVHPTNTPVAAKRRRIDGRIALWFNHGALQAEGAPLVVLSRDDALGLIDMMQMLIDLGDAPDV